MHYRVDKKVYFIALVVFLWLPSILTSVGFQPKLFDVAPKLVSELPIN